MVVMKEAKRPNFSDVEDPEPMFGYRCDTCHQQVKQPYLKGLWYHVYNFSEDPYGCQNLVPVEYEPFDQWECDHDMRFNKDLKLALKCTKCGFPIEFDRIEDENYLAEKFFCIECNKEFSVMSRHCKKHKAKPFEFQVIK